MFAELVFGHGFISSYIYKYIGYCILGAAYGISALSLLLQGKRNGPGRDWCRRQDLKLQMPLFLQTDKTAVADHDVVQHRNV